MEALNEMTGSSAAPCDAAPAVDLGLVLAVDCSSSVDAADFRIQMDGIAAALRNPLLREAIKSGERGRIALSLVQWSGLKSQVIALPWRLLGSGADLEIVAREIEAAQRQWQPGGTGLAAAIDFSVGVVGTLASPAERWVIDVSGDGEDNEGGDTLAARNRANALGITINGLPIVSGSRRLFGYYRDQVIGGTGAFLVPAANIMSFHDSILRKLLREIRRPVS
jgi:hypothetical protein